MNTSHVIENIKQVAARVLPKGSTLYLYGSRARGDNHEDSDWDILIVVDKDQLLPDDYDTVTYPLTKLGWELGTDIERHGRKRIAVLKTEVWRHQALLRAENSQPQYCWL